MVRKGYYDFLSSYLAGTFVKKQLWGGKFWSEGGYVGTLGEGVTEDVIRNYIERQGSSEEKEKYKQMRLIEV